MKHHLILATTLLMASSLAGPGQASDSDAIDQLLGLLEGRYQSPALLDPELEGPQLTDHRVRVDSPALGVAVMYWQLDSGPEQRIYRQRLLIFSLDPESGRIVQGTWSLADPERFDASQEQAALFATLSEGDLVRELPEDCDPVWEQRPEGWYGRTDPARCKIFSERHQDWRHIEAELTLGLDGLSQAERGFDGEGRQLFGTAPGELFRLARVGP